MEKICIPPNRWGEQINKDCSGVNNWHLSLFLPPTISFSLHLHYFPLSCVLWAVWDNACLAGSTFLFSYTQCHVAFTGDQAWDEERGRKKIRKLALMKTRSQGILAMNLEKERRIEVNSNQLAAMPDDKALKCFPPSFPFRSFLTFSYRGERSENPLSLTDSPG